MNPYLKILEGLSLDQMHEVRAERKSTIAYQTTPPAPTHSYMPSSRYLEQVEAARVYVCDPEDLGWECVVYGRV